MPKQNTVLDYKAVNNLHTILIDIKVTNNAIETKYQTIEMRSFPL